MPPTPGPLEYRKKQAKQLIKAARAAEPEALRRVQLNHPQFAQIDEGKGPEGFQLTHAQLVIAREYGFSSWPEMKAAVEAQPQMERYSPYSRLETPYADVLKLVASVEFRSQPEATLRRKLHPQHDAHFINDILSIIGERPEMLQERHAQDWDGILYDRYYAPDYGEYLSEND